MHYSFSNHTFKGLISNPFIFPFFFDQTTFCPSLTGWILLSFELLLFVCPIWNCIMYFRPKMNYFAFRCIYSLDGSFSTLLSATPLQASCGLTLLHLLVNPSRHCCRLFLSWTFSLEPRSVFCYKNNILIYWLCRLPPPCPAATSLMDLLQLPFTTGSSSTSFEHKKVRFFVYVLLFSSKTSATLINLFYLLHIVCLGCVGVYDSIQVFLHIPADSIKSFLTDVRSVK